jgi:hypothetical protein
LNVMFTFINVYMMLKCMHTSLEYRLEKNLYYYYFKINKLGQIK